jgi:hypothetical protein
MTFTPEDGDGVPSHEGRCPATLRGGSQVRLLLFAVAGGVVALVVAATLMVVGSSGGGDGGSGGGVGYLPDEPLPATGTYVVRVIHTGGSHEPFALGFVGNA